MGKAIKLRRVIFKLFFFLALCGCGSEGGGKKNSTPPGYKYKLEQYAGLTYTNDTTVIRAILTKMRNEKIKPFNLKMYDEQTDLFIDSVVYSPDQLRMILFVITRNSTSKMLRRENESSYYYDAYYLYCSRDSLKEPIKVYDYAGYRLSFFYHYPEISGTLRDYCFNQLLELDGTEQHYNIDDKRFWSSKDFEWLINNSKTTKL